MSIRTRRPQPPALKERNPVTLLEGGNKPYTMRLAGGYVRKDLAKSKWMEGGKVVVSTAIWNYVAEHMVYEHDQIYLAIIQITNTNTYRLFAKYEFIIGSRLVAVLNSKQAVQFIRNREVTQ